MIQSRTVIRNATIYSPGDRGEPGALVIKDGKYPHRLTFGFCGGLIRIYQGAVREAAKHNGTSMIETTDNTISLEDAACG